MHRTTLEIDGLSIPVTFVNTVIVGAGAAGMGCAVRLADFWRARGVADPGPHVLVVTGGLGLGASRMSGSDKQTYYKMGTSPRVPDTADDFAAALTALGCCHGDTALVEGIASLRGFYRLVDVGVPFPHDPQGAFIGYKTDHDPYERATSAGPKTSKFMSERLQDVACRGGVEIVDKHPVVRFITSSQGAEKRIAAMVCFDLARKDDGDLPLSVFVAENWVLSAGGPGEIYAASVYPRGQIGIGGPALQAGLEACNLTESQFGLASTKFRWNVSGTYMQVIPRIYSTDTDGGDEREFLCEYFDDMASMATNIFLKGYQWPFDSQRITDHQSSLIDMAVHQETVVHNRRVWMDFLRNPVPGDGWDEFAIESLAAEAREYLCKTGATQPTPIQRLAHMNPPAIDIYAEHGIDLHLQPLEIALCAQHSNGGFAVDKWWQSNLIGTFVIGEMAGTHGVKRPGGAALNAGQVGALRAAQFITAVGSPSPADPDAPAETISQGVGETVGELRDMLAKGASASITAAAAMDEIRVRMTRYGAHLRWASGARDALGAAKEQYRRLRADGLRIESPRQLLPAIQASQQCLMHIAILKGVCGMFDRGAGSRGSHCILDDGGIEMHPRLIDPATDKPYRFRPENESLRREILHLRYDPSVDDLFETRACGLRPIPDRDIAFEPAWAEFRDGKIYGI